jgi:anti-sigma regulatory factor (Ser/Thr protein kinase)
MKGGRAGQLQIARMPLRSADTHLVLPYSSRGQCASSVLSFISAGLARQEPVCLAVTPPVAQSLRDTAAGPNALAGVQDITELGRNPGRIIAAVWDFIAANPDRRAWWVEEPLWPGRSQAEAAETLRHEVLVNLAFRGVEISTLCLYDRSSLEPHLLRAAESAHPGILTGGQPAANGDYLGLGVMPPDYEQPLDPPPPAAVALTYASDLRPVRAAVSARAASAGMSADRTVDLVLAVSEVAANSLRHADGAGVLLTWCADGEIVCQVNDGGTVTDPLAGRRRAARDADGHGLWVVNQVCDLVELRSAPGRTTVRMHMRL